MLNKKLKFIKGAALSLFAAVLLLLFSSTQVEATDATTEITATAITSTEVAGLLESNATASQTTVVAGGAIINLGAAGGKDAITITATGANARQIFTFSGTNDVKFKENIDVGGASATPHDDFTLTLNATTDDLIFEGNILAKGAAAGLIFINSGSAAADGTTTLTFDTLANENHSYDAVINAVDAADNVNIVIQNGDSGNANTQTFVKAIGGSTDANKIDAITLAAATTATFTSTINAGTITSSSTNVTTFNGDVTANLVYAAAGTYTFGADDMLVGSVTNGSDGQGTLKFTANTADQVSVSGTTGALGGALLALDIETGASAGLEQEFTGAVFARTITLTGAGTVNFMKDVTAATKINFNNTAALIVMAADKKIVGLVDAASNDGTLTFLPTTVDTTLVSGTIGVATADIASLVVAPVSGVTGTFGAAVETVAFAHNGAGTVVAAGTWKAASVISANGIFTLGGAHTGAIDNTSGANGSGTINLGATFGVTGIIGNTHSLLAVNSDSTGGTTAFGAAVKATTVTLGGTGATTLADDVTGTVVLSGASGTPSVTVAADKKIIGAITTTTTNITKLDFDATTTDTTMASTTIGASGLLLKEVEVEPAGSGTTSTFGGDIYTTLLDLQGSHAAAETALSGDCYCTTVNFTHANGSILLLADGSDVTGDITTSNTNKGTITTVGDSIITGNIGANGALLKKVNVAANKKLTVSGNLYVTTTTLAAGAATTLTFSHATASAGGNILTCTGACTVDVGTATVAMAGAVDISTTGSTFKVTIGTTNGHLNGAAGVAMHTGNTLVPTIKGAIVSGAEVRIATRASGGAIAIPGTITDNYDRYDFVALNCTGATDELCLKATVVAPTGLSSAGAAINAVVDVAFASDAAMVDALNGLSGAAMDKALVSLAPVVSGGAIVGAVSASGAAGVTISTQVVSLREGIAAGQGLNAGDGTAKEERFWTQGFGSHAEQELREKINGFTSFTGGVAFGVDKRVQDDLLVGLAYSYAYTDVDSSLSLSNTNVQSYQATLYGSFDVDQSIFQMDGVFLDGQLSYAHNNYDGERHFEVGAVKRRADSDYDGMQISTKLDLGKTIQLGEGFRFTPTAGIGYTHVAIDEYTESNAGASSLKLNEQDYDILNLNVNAKIATTYQVEGSDFTPEVHFGYTYEAIHDNVLTTSTFTGGGDSFKSVGFSTANSTGRAGAGFTYAGDTMPVDLTVTYDATVKDDFVSHSGLIKGSWAF